MLNGTVDVENGNLCKGMLILSSLFHCKLSVNIHNGLWRLQYLLTYSLEVNIHVGGTEEEQRGTSFSESKQSSVKAATLLTDHYFSRFRTGISWFTEATVSQYHRPWICYSKTSGNAACWDSCSLKVKNEACDQKGNGEGSWIGKCGPTNKKKSHYIVQSLKNQYQGTQPIWPFGRFI